MLQLVADWVQREAKFNDILLWVNTYITFLGAGQDGTTITQEFVRHIYITYINLNMQISSDISRFTIELFMNCADSAKICLFVAHGLVYSFLLQRRRVHKYFSETPIAIGKRIAIVAATAGCGKSYVAKSLAGSFGFSYVSNDALLWRGGWSDNGNPMKVPKEERIHTYESKLSGDSWVIGGCLKVCNT